MEADLLGLQSEENSQTLNTEGSAHQSDSPPSQEAPASQPEPEVAASKASNPPDGSSSPDGTANQNEDGAPSSGQSNVAVQPDQTAVDASNSGVEKAADEDTTSATITEQEPVDPVLREIKEKFGGRWKLVRSDPYGDYLKSVGLGLVARKRASTGSTEQRVTIKDEQIFINFNSTFHSQNYVLKLDDARENEVQKMKQSVFCSYKDGKLILNLTPVEEGWNKTQEIERFINDMGEHVVIYTAGSAVCRRYFAKIPEPGKS